MALDVRKFGPKSDKIGAHRGAFVYQEPFKKDSSTASRVINEVVMERLYEKWFSEGILNLPGFIGGSVNGLRPVVVGGVHCIRCSRLLRTLLVERRRSDGGCDGC